MSTTLPGTNVWHNMFGMQTSFCAVIRQPSGGGGAFWSVGTATTDNDSSVFPAVNTWYHVALVRRGSSIKLYVNGVLVVDATDATAGATGFIIGDIDANNNGDEFIGRLAAVKVWQRDLSRSEVIAESKQYLPVSKTNLLGVYPLRRLADDENELYRAAPLTLGGAGQAEADGPPCPWQRRSYTDRRIATFAAQAVGGSTFTASLSGSVTASGALAKQVNKAFAGSSTATGALAKLAAKALAGSSTGSGAIAKLVSKALAGSSTPSGALSLIRAVLISLGGSVTASGALAKSVGKSVAGSITPAGSLAKSCAKALAGSVTAAGVLAKVIAKPLAGTSTPSGALTRLVGKGLSGSSAAAGAITKAVSKSLAGSVTPTGALAKSLAKALSGAVTAVGVLTLVSNAIVVVTRILAHLLGLDEPVKRTSGLHEPTLRADGEEQATIRRKGLDE
jgi:hypothetical protein